MPLLAVSGKITFLRVNEVGTGFGPPSDFIDVEAVVILRDIPGAFGFQLRPDANRVARQGMLDLLRDAFNNDWTVSIDYNVPDGRVHGVILRIALTR